MELINNDTSRLHDDPLEGKSNAFKKRLRRQTEQRRNQSNNNSLTPFRKVEKFYQDRSRLLDLDNCIDIRTLEHKKAKDILVQEYGSNELKTIQAFELDDELPGLFVLPNALNVQEQKKLIRNCLEIHAKYPNPSNLDNYYEISREGIWDMAKKGEEISKKLENEKEKVFIEGTDSKGNTFTKNSDVENSKLSYFDEPIDTLSPSSSNSTPSSEKIGLPIDNSTPSPSKIGLFIDNSTPSPSPSRSTLTSFEVLRKLRWITLGYKYIWGTKSYDMKCLPLPFPQDIGRFVESVVQSIENTKYIAEAGVINFYQPRDTLMGHIDESESENGLLKPLVSISLGLACVFLISPTRLDEPKAIILRSGDMIIMSKNSRNFQHGVPRIISSSLPISLIEKDEEIEWKMIMEYMKTTRININVRQVN